MTWKWITITVWWIPVHDAFDKKKKVCQWSWQSPSPYVSETDEVPARDQISCRYILSRSIKYIPIVCTGCELYNLLFAVAWIAQSFIMDHYNDLAGLDNNLSGIYNDLAYWNMIIGIFSVRNSSFAHFYHIGVNIYLQLTFRLEKAVCFTILSIWIILFKE